MLLTHRKPRENRSGRCAPMSGAGPLPRRLYEVLPAIYVTGGVLSMAFAANGIGLASGALLASAGVAIFRLRWAYRST